MEEFYTIEKSAETLTVIKKSKFISTVRPIKTQKEAETIIDSLKKKYWDATHNVYAYCIGLRDDVQKFSDDGEPSGTAGRPVLEVIKSKELKNVLVVVTRYFGGTLLGAGGLVRAYSESAARGLDEAKIIKKIKCQEFLITTDYNLHGKLEWELNERNIIIKDTKYTENVTIKALVPLYYNLDFISLVKNLTSDTAKAEMTHEYFITEPRRR